MKHFWILIILVVIVTLISVLMPRNVAQAPVSHTKNTENTENPPALAGVKKLSVGDTTIYIEVAHTIEERTRGLSGRADLEPNSGLFFVFERAQYAGIWMKDMNFSIDIVWIDENLIIVDIESDVAPQTFPKIFTPSKKSLYVLELPAGFVQSHQIKIGDAVLVST